MAVLNQICASWTDLAKQTKEFEAELNTIEAGIRSTVDSILNGADETALSQQVDAAIHEANSFFAQQSIGGLNQVLSDSGIATATTDSKKCAEDLGFYKANGRYWKTNANINIQSEAQHSYGFVGIGSGEYTPERITTVLGRDYADPSDTAIQEMLQTAHAGSNQRQATTQVNDAGSVTGSRTVPGNIANIRELYRGCGSDMSTLSSFLSESYALGFGCVWSTTHVTVVTKPTTLQASEFTPAYVRKQLNKVLFDSDMDFNRDSRYCFVREEIYLGHNIPRKDIQARASLYETQLAVPVGSLALIPRVVRFKPQEDSVGTTPLLVSRGCDPSKLSSTSYLLGISVNDIYRVIDCTGDSGQKITRNTYTVQDIVDSITEVFGDLVECGSVGSEFFIRLKPGFGTLGSISLFYVPDGDCSEVIGMQGCINESAQGKALIQNRNLIVPELSKVREVFWYGGASTPTPGTSSFFVTYLNAGNLYTEQKKSLLQQETYCDMISSSVSRLSSELSSSFANKDTAAAVKQVRALEELLTFYDVSSFSYREFQTVKSALGTSLHRLLVYDTSILSLDAYTSKQTVRDNLSNVLNSLVANDGVVSNTTTWSTVSLPYDLNYSTAARARLLYAEATEYDYLNEALAAQALGDLNSYSSSIASATNSVVSKTSSSSTFTKILDGADSLLDAVGTLVDSDMNRVVWNAIKNIPGVSEAIGSERYLENKLSQLGNGIDAGVRSVQELVSDLLSSLGISSLDRKAVSVLLQAQACLDSAQRIVNSIKTTYNTTTRKIVVLSNFNMNFAGKLGFQSKYLSCYVSGTLDYQSTVSLAKMLQIINEAAEALNNRLRQLVDMVDSAIDKLLCLLDKLTASLTGSMSYETTMQVGMVTMKANCVSYVSLGATFSPDVLAHIMDLRRQVDFLLASMKLQSVTFKSHQQNLQATGTVFTATLQDTVDLILSKVTKCF